jgi:hypothetical protein
MEEAQVYVELMRGGTVCYSKLLVQKLRALDPQCGVEDAVYLSALARITGGDWAYTIAEQLYEETGLTAKRQWLVHERLCHLDLLEYGESDSSGLSYVRINVGTLIDIIKEDLK